jgi:glycosyltransferase involved in cell wall biosynthesis
MPQVPTGPLVSIITPTLNQGRFIEASIRSIKGQTYSHYEHIIVDGGSTDGTLDILRAHEGTYPMRWLSEPDRGMYDAVNKGMGMARGEILAYLNSDDLYFPWTIAAVVDGLTRYSGAGAVHGDSIKIDLADGRQRATFEPPFRRSVVAAAGPWAGLVQPTVFWRRSVWETIGPFDGDLRYVGDREYFLRIGARFRFRRIDEFLAVECLHERNLSTTGRSQLETEDDAAIPRPRDRPTLLRARVYGAVWRRILWLRFVGAAIRRKPVGSWSQFLGDPATQLSIGRALIGQIPRVSRRFLPDAIRSERY